MTVGQQIPFNAEPQSPVNNQGTGLRPRPIAAYSKADLKEVHGFEQDGKRIYYRGRFWIILAVPELLFILSLVFSLTIDEFKNLQDDYLWAFITLAISVTTLIGWAILELHQFTYWDEDSFVYKYTDKQLNKREAASPNSDNAGLLEYAGIRKGRARGGGK